MCNYMKKSLHKDIFVQCVEHIATYNKLVDGKLYPNAFKNYTPKYSSYKYSSNKKGFIFDISEDLFDNTKEEMETRAMKTNLGEQYIYIKQLKNVLKLKGVQARLPYEMIIE